MREGWQWIWTNISNQPDVTDHQWSRMKVSFLRIHTHTHTHTHTYISIYIYIQAGKRSMYSSRLPAQPFSKGCHSERDRFPAWPLPCIQNTFCEILQNLWIFPLAPIVVEGGRHLTAINKGLLLLLLWKGYHPKLDLKRHPEGLPCIQIIELYHQEKFHCIISL